MSRIRATFLLLLSETRFSSNSKQATSRNSVRHTYYTNQYSTSATHLPPHTFIKTRQRHLKFAVASPASVFTNSSQKSEFTTGIVKDALKGCRTVINKVSSTSHYRAVVSYPKMVDVSTASDQIQASKLLDKDEFEEFNAVFPEISRFLTEIPEFRDMPETNRWLARVLQYNVPHGKRNRGLATALAYRYLTDELHEGNVKLSYVLGWTVEMLQAFFLMADDIMDGSETRRGRPCWYKVNDVGSGAVNDAIMVEGAIYTVLKHYFKEKDYYVDLLEIMHDVTYKTIYGQNLDTRTGDERKMETYSMEKYNVIVKYKTSYYSFYLPLRLAMAMTGFNDADLIRQVKTVMLEMGHFFQVQDDFLDCFGDTNVTGKIGTDIQDCKCSWLFVTALEKATPEQRRVLLENYGQSNQSSVDRVKGVYLEMKLPELYENYEQQSFLTISTHIQQMSPRLPKKLFTEMLNKIYQRRS